jgi:hypothetical protein
VPFACHSLRYIVARCGPGGGRRERIDADTSESARCRLWCGTSVALRPLPSSASDRRRVHVHGPRSAHVRHEARGLRVARRDCHRPQAWCVGGRSAPRQRHDRSPARGREARSLHHRRLCVAVACGSPSGSSERKPISTPTPATSPRAHNCTGGIHIRLDGAGSRAQQISGAAEQLRSSPASGIRHQASQTPPSRITLERGADGGDVRGEVGGRLAVRSVPPATRS